MNSACSLLDLLWLQYFLLPKNKVLHGGNLLPLHMGYVHRERGVTLWIPQKLSCKPAGNEIPSVTAFSSMEISARCLQWPNWKRCSCVGFYWDHIAIPLSFAAYSCYPEIWYLYLQESSSLVAEVWNTDGTKTFWGDCLEKSSWLWQGWSSLCSVLTVEMALPCIGGCS